MFHCTVAGKKMTLNAAQFILVAIAFLSFAFYAIYLISIGYGRYLDINSAFVGVVVCVFAFGAEINGKRYATLPTYMVPHLMLLVSSIALLIHGLYLYSGFFDLGVLTIFILANVAMIKSKA